ncbi:MAG: hypothetical protein ABUL48_04340, partial [Pseudorhodoplanes sp.]
QLAIPVANGPPPFNTEPTCRGAATAGAAVPGAKQACLDKEKRARDELNQQWVNFPGADRSRCVQSTSAGGIPSYVELLTCLETAKQVRALPKDNGLPGDSGSATTGSAPSR